MVLLSVFITKTGCTRLFIIGDRNGLKPDGGEVIRCVATIIVSKQVKVTGFGCFDVLVTENGFYKEFLSECNI